MQMIADNEAHLVQLEPGMGYTVGEYFNMQKQDHTRYSEVHPDKMMMMIHFIIVSVPRHQRDTC